MYNKLLKFIQENRAVSHVTFVGVAFLFLLAVACVLFNDNDPYATITSALLLITTVLNVTIVNLFT